MANEDTAEEASALLALFRADSRSEARASLMEDLAAYGSAVDLWRKRHPAALFEDPVASAQLEQARVDLEQWRRDDRFDMVTIFDEEYPVRLRGVHQAPPFLFAQGTLIPDDEAVAVVGSRDASAVGLSVAAAVAAGLVEHGWTVASGLARGVDTAAHTAALDAGGRTVAVVPTGICRSYPPENRRLQAEIGARGLVVSQFWPDAEPDRSSFLTRNATMSGYSLATVVVEAGERSGARAQARMAVEHGRGVVLTDRVVSANAGHCAMRARGMSPRSFLPAGSIRPSETTGHSCAEWLGTSILCAVLGRLTAARPCELAASAFPRKLAPSG